MHAAEGGDEPCKLVSGGVRAHHDLPDKEDKLAHLSLHHRQGDSTQLLDRAPPPGAVNVCTTLYRQVIVIVRLWSILGGDCMRITLLVPAGKFIHEAECVGAATHALHLN